MYDEFLTGFLGRGTGHALRVRYGCRGERRHDDAMAE